MSHHWVPVTCPRLRHELGCFLLLSSCGVSVCLSTISFAVTTHCWVCISDHWNLHVLRHWVSQCWHADILVSWAALRSIRSLDCAFQETWSHYLLEAGELNYRWQALISGCQVRLDLRLVLKATIGKLVRLWGSIKGRVRQSHGIHGDRLFVIIFKQALHSSLCEIFFLFSLDCCLSGLSSDCINLWGRIAKPFFNTKLLFRFIKLCD